MRDNGPKVTWSGDRICRVFFLALCFAAFALRAETPVSRAIRRSGNNVIISWPTPSNETTYVVRATTNLNDPWRLATPAPIVNDLPGSRSLSFPLSGGARFFDVRRVDAPELIGQWPGFARGRAIEIEVVGETAYVATDLRGLSIFNISNPATPVVMGNYPSDWFIEGMHVVDGYAYLAVERRGLDVVDVRDAARPRRVGSLYTSGHAVDVQVVGNYAYVAAVNAGLRIVDVSSPANPVARGFLRTGGIANSVRVIGNHALVAFYDGGLVIVDVSDVNAPISVGTYKPDGAVGDVELFGNYAYITVAGDNFRGLEILDVREPTSPARVSQLYNPWGPGIVRLGGNHLYWMTSTPGVRIYDLANPTNLVLLHTHGATDYGRDAAEISDVTLLAMGEAGVHVLRRGTNMTPALLTKLDTAGFGSEVARVGQYLYLADTSAGLRIVDNSDPARPRELSRYGYPSSYTFSVDVAGPYAYVLNASQANALEIVDISNPANPVLKGAMDLWPWPDKIRVRDGHAYLARSGVTIVDVTNPAKPLFGGSYNPGGITYDLEIQNDLVYLANGVDGLRILRLVSPTNLVYVGGLSLGGGATIEAVDVSGPRAYLAGPKAGVYIVDVADPANPQLISTAVGSSDPYDAHELGQYLLVADGPAGLKVFDISNPALPVHLAGLPTGTGAASITVLGSDIHVVDWTFGVRTIRIPGLIP